MQRFKNILLVTDRARRGKAALDRAMALAKRNRARLTVVEVIEEGPQDVSAMASITPTIDVRKLVFKERAEAMERFVAPLMGEENRLCGIVLAGRPFVEITRQVQRENHDLVMMTAAGHHRPAGWLFGSTAKHLMRKCPCPVWVVKPMRRHRYARILAAVDLTPSDPKRDTLNAKIMDLATSLAQLERSELHIVHVWSFWGESILRLRAQVPRKEVEKCVREARALSQTRLNEFVQSFRLGTVNHRVHLLKGEPGQLIPQLAEKKQINIIVMGTVCRTGLAGFFIGNAAERVLEEVDCSVLTVKPDGFVSPVTLDDDSTRKPI